MNNAELNALKGSKELLRFFVIIEDLIILGLDIVESSSIGILLFSLGK
jgi:hypothetical protein